MRVSLCALFLLIFASIHLHAEVAVPLRAGDIFEMHLGGIPQEFASEFGFQYTIDQDGTVNVPVVGEVKAAGLTPAQLERVIEKKLIAGKIFTNPAVLINVSAAARFVSMSGGVRNPQRLTWSPDLTLFSAIAECAGLTDFAKDHGIQIIRDAKVFGTYNLKVIRRDPAQDPKLLPGDHVIVPE